MLHKGCCILPEAVTTVTPSSIAKALICSYTICTQLQVFFFFSHNQNSEIYHLYFDGMYIV